jgi:Ca2+-binding RTX toxin-like protein
MDRVMNSSVSIGKKILYFVNDIAGATGRETKFALTNKAGANPEDAQDRIIYNNTTGTLFYDPDGSDPTRAMQFAKINGGLKLTAADLLVI